MIAKNIRKITTTGKTSTYYVTLPKDMVKDLNWRKGQKVVVTRSGNDVLIQDCKE